MELEIVKCFSCKETFDTWDEMRTHHVDTHARPLPLDCCEPSPRQPWEINALTAPPYHPPNWKAQAARELLINGGKA